MVNFLSKKESNNFDQFYTNPLTAKKLTSIFVEKLQELGYQKLTFIEPSAGTGNFLEAIKKISKNSFFISRKILAFDIEPKTDQENIIKTNFLTLNWKRYLVKSNNYVVLGNPPFGKKGNLAADFINKAVEKAETIGFILPLTFRRWSIQSQLNKNLQLIYDIDLEPNSFIYQDKVYTLNACFQIWTKRKNNYLNLRIKERPITKHPDFEMYLHNNTRPTLKFFQKNKYNWDFAVVRQGFYDYTQKIVRKKDLFKNRQYIFFKSKDELVKQRLLKLDFPKLAQKNTIIPGFGKHDVVIAYKKLENVAESI